MSKTSPESALLQELYQRYFQEIRAYLLKNFGSGPPDPDDVVQQAFTQYAAKNDKNDVKNPRAFLYASARNLVLDAKRRDKTHREYFEETANFQPEEYEFSPERVLLARERVEILYGALEKMPKKRRQMLMLNGIDGLGFSEIARREGMTEGGVRKHVKHALLDCLNAMDEADKGAGDSVDSEGGSS